MNTIKEDVMRLSGIETIEEGKFGRFIAGAALIAGAIAGLCSMKTYGVQSTIDNVKKVASDAYVGVKNEISASVDNVRKNGGIFPESAARVNRNDRTYNYSISYNKSSDTSTIMIYLYPDTEWRDVGTSYGDKTIENIKSTVNEIVARTTSEAAKNGSSDAELKMKICLEVKNEKDAEIARRKTKDVLDFVRENITGNVELTMIYAD